MRGKTVNTAENPFFAFRLYSGWLLRPKGFGAKLREVFGGTNLDGSYFARATNNRVLG